jgi:septal ring factor EnvC (AmiA/AmiB activator)
MKSWVPAFLIIFLLAAPAASATTQERVTKIRGLVARQKGELDDTKNRLGWTWDQLQSAETQIAQVAKERDGWKSYGDDQHDRFMNAEKRVVTEKLSKLRWQVAFGGLLTLVLAFVGLKFFTPIGKFI